MTPLEFSAMSDAVEVEKAWTTNYKIFPIPTVDGSWTVLRQNLCEQGVIGIGHGGIKERAKRAQTQEPTESASVWRDNTFFVGKSIKVPQRNAKLATMTGNAAKERCNKVYK